MAAVRLVQSILSGEHSVVVDSLLVGYGFFETLGVKPQLGRYFDSQDYAAESVRIVVLSHRLWTERYNSDPSIIGREVTIEGAAQRVIGIMPPGFYPSRWSEPAAMETATVGSSHQIQPRVLGAYRLRAATARRGLEPSSG